MISLEIMNVSLRIGGTKNNENKISEYTNILYDVFDKHDPAWEKNVVQRQNNQWYTEKE